MNPQTLLRTEGAAVFAVATAAYVAVGGPLWLYLAVALVPDLSMVGYVAGSQVGSKVYNAAHTYLLPIGIGAAGVGFGIAVLPWIALVWTAHIGIDRALGYGLKYPTGFKETHLSTGENRDRPQPETVAPVGTDD